MLDRNTVEEQIKFTLDTIDVPGFGDKIKGKVRDCYVCGDQRVIIASDRLSAFDVVLTTIPFKGQLLTQMASYWFSATEHIVPNHIIEIPHPNVVITKQVEILPIEVVVRGYLTGSAWRDYEAGRAVSGIDLPRGMKRSAQFDQPLITPSTKAEQGQHDEPISSEEIVRSGIIEASLWQQVCEAALKLFAFGTERAREQGLILVDTNRHEFGVLKDSSGTPQLILADEIHTQDSSRYWILQSYQDLFENNQDPDMLDKEFVRQWLIEQGYMGEGTPPDFPDSFRADTAIRYIDAFERITGQEFTAEVGATQETIIQALNKYRPA